ncbi:MAG: hypothetical protein A2785_03170 [Candidatus Chisholmbacteria bacterium RIFCSPHIGHO2_01_FULL_49_18]|uniref:Queuosine 5'-phosphate N-glycosylase/hydrolase n=1 Tax=Candidatus Chisholmbacteria bacterium RIFCSPHIGHO2_01_FULL_49_18 TaxID=1797590 RepID=A0A1G1VMW5_9BACT|nr:MAG: hypothetical protein A2785_03170 [Candidatus Chisholmbacteria bacterium RIFCSPHIGHO2_01_FULL_49_18]
MSQKYRPRINKTLDPLEVRRTTSEVVGNLQFVKIDHNRIGKVVHTLKARLKSRRLLTETQFGKVRIEPQRVFIQDAINFCFWSRKGESKWAIEFPSGETKDGWNALVASFDRALKEGVPLLQADYIAKITQTDTSAIFRSCNETEIPLLKQRTAILRESGRILQKDFNGNIKNLIKQADYDAASIALTTIKHFPSFRDSSRINGKKVNFFKRAQIFAYDLSLLKYLNITNIVSLTAFADYKLPQLLRSLGILRYKNSLAQKVDAMQLIQKDSREEVEIRAATIWVCDRFAEILRMPAATIDNALWTFSQERTKTMKPYHRIRTTCY